MITQKITMSSLSSIEVDPVDTSFLVEGGFEKLFSQIEGKVVLNMIEFKTMLQTFLSQYDIAWNQLNEALKFQERAESFKESEKYTGGNLSSAFSGLKVSNNYEQLVKNYIQILDKGRNILNFIRQKITGQAIMINISITTDEQSTYYLSQDQVPYKLVLNTYGAGGNNFVSLAYKVDINQVLENEKLQVLASLEDSKNKNLISSKDIYWKVYNNKTDYLKYLEAKNHRKYNRQWWDSKDAEIFDLYKQLYLNKEADVYLKTLTAKRYINYRKSMGGGGGYHSSAFQTGDVGLVQDKTVNKKSSSIVNVMRQTMIRGHFQSLLNAANIGTGALKGTIRELFSEKQSRVNSEVTKMTNKEARKMIQQLQIK